MDIDTLDRIAELEGLVRYHRDIYYNHPQNVELTDAEFDSIESELRGLCPTSAVLSEVGAEADGEKVKHQHHMGSLNKVTWENDDFEGLRNWIGKSITSILDLEKPPLVVTPKMDGAACRINYVNGKLVQAATRGNGEFGTDVTENAKAVRGVPLTMSDGFTGEIRGEVCMKKSVFERLCKEGVDIANPRNAASGVLTAKDSSKVREKDLDFIAYDVICDHRIFRKESEKFAFLVARGLQVVKSQLLDEREVKAVLFDWENTGRDEFEYPIDGLVFAYDSISDQDDAGYTGGRPGGKMAWKFRPEQRVAKFLGYSWQVGRTGRITPVVQVSPTKLAGTTVQFLTMHNWKNVQELGLCDGDEILIQKGGDIIPGVVGRVTTTKGNVVPCPTNCPCCDSVLQLDDNRVSLYCRNLFCQSRLEARVEHYLKRMEILGIGPKTIQEMCSRGMVKDISDLYSVDVRELQAITGGKTAAKNIYTAILGRCEVPLAQFLSALGIGSLGRTTSKIIAKKFKTLEGARKASAMVLISMDGIGEKMATEIINGFDRMSETIDRIIAVIDVLDEKESVGPLVGKSFCLTGSMSRNRKEIEADIESAGGTIKSGVGKGLDFLVQADPTSESGKSIKARSFGTRVIGEEELAEMMA